MAMLAFPVLTAAAGYFIGPALGATALLGAQVGWAVSSSIGQRVRRPAPGEPNEADDEHSERLDTY